MALGEQLQKAIEAAAGQNAVLQFEVTQSSETENETTNLAVAFDEASGTKTLSISNLVKRLSDILPGIDVDAVGPPHSCVILQGAAGTQMAKVVIRL